MYKKKKKNVLQKQKATASISPLSEFAEIDKFVAPLASFDTVDLSDDDICFSSSDKTGSALKYVQHSVSNQSSADTGTASELDVEKADRDASSNYSSFKEETESELDEASDAIHQKRDIVVDYSVLVNEKDKESDTDCKDSRNCANISSQTAQEVISTPGKKSPTGESKPSLPPPSVHNSNSSDSDSISTSDSEECTDKTKRHTRSVTRTVCGQKIYIYGRLSCQSPIPDIINDPSPRRTVGAVNEQVPQKTVEEESIPLETIDLATIKGSKRKAYLRKLQRMQVKTSPIERPRSTNPINVTALNEYTNISSPEHSPSHDKIRITLPDDEFTPKPRNSPHQMSRNSGTENRQTDFPENQLFCHTKSGLLVSDNSTSQLSPRHVLIPPTLTQTGSPKQLVSTSPKYVYCPQTNTHFEYPPASQNTIAKTTSVIPSNWVKFDDESGFIKNNPVVRKSPIPARTSQVSGSAVNSRASTAVTGVPEKIAHSIPDCEDEVLTVTREAKISGEKDCGIKISSSAIEQSASLANSQNKMTILQPANRTSNSISSNNRGECFDTDHQQQQQQPLSMKNSQDKNISDTVNH